MKNTRIFPVNMKYIIPCFNKCILFLGLLILCTDAFALKEEYITQLQGQQVAVDSVLRNRDPLMPVDLNDLTSVVNDHWFDGMSHYRVRNRIKLEINPYVFDACMPDSFGCSVTLRILRLDKDYNLDSIEQTLTVTYNGKLGAQYNAIDIYTFENYHYVQVKVLSVSCGSSTAKFLTIKNEIEIDRFYDISLSTGPTISSVTHLNATKEIEVIWTYISGIIPEEYDLEWTFVDNYKDIGQFFTSSQTEYTFKNNSTRISTKNNSYKISAAFERGFLLFRVRAIGKKGEHFTHRISGPWSTTTESGFVSSYPSSSRIEITSDEEHQPTLNWQFSATFAEDGKKKEIISYFDGSLRNRQTVTRNNTDTTAIATETIYDHQGRPAVNTLPVPTAQNILKYYADFSLNLSNNPYSRADFDIDTGTCAAESQAMSINAGASKYYSVNNPYQSLSTHYKYVPDALGFAFTQVQYTPDNTGRISRQSGVGADHVLGSGHETQYFYGTPFQEELDMLFGNSVGYAEHYQKNMVVDANGQVSISYLNLAGKTIATALAGPKPSNVDSLSSFIQPQTLQINLQNSADTSYAEGEIRLSKTFTVTHTQVYSFKYSMEADTFTSNCIENVCLDCVYDLSITLTDICGNNLLDGDNNVAGITMLQRTIGKDGGEFDTVCNESAIAYSFESDIALNDSINVTLQPGVYTITKTLSVNKEAMEFYADVFVNNNTCLKTLDSFEQEFLEATDFSGCGMSCEECVDRLGGRDSFISVQVALLVEDSITVSPVDSAYLSDLYDSLVAVCLKPCQEKDPCEAALQMLKMDVSPGGQYALIADENGDFNDSTILNTVSYKYSGNYKYKKTGSVYVKMQYTDAYGNLDSVDYMGVMTSPADLPYEAFINNFQESWADSLIQFHPEFCNYRWCLFNREGLIYDQRMLKTETYDAAQDSGYLNPMLMPLAAYNAVEMDPYFNSWGIGDSAAIKTKMTTFVTESSTDYSIWQLPLMIFHCNERTTKSYVDSCLTGLTMNDPACGPHQNSMWQMFRALYLTEKGKLMEGRKQLIMNCASTSLIKQKRFYTADDAENLYATTGASTAQEATDSLKKQCTLTCEAYAEMWMQKLEGCNLNSTDSAKLADSLVKVCIYGCDANNPLGASSVAAAYQSGTTPGYKTFQAAVKGIATLVPGICDANLIGFPMEYGHDYFSTDNPFADTCMCNRTPAPTGDTACACDETKEAMKLHVLSQFKAAEKDKCKDCIRCENLAIALGVADTTYGVVLTDTTKSLRTILTRSLNNYLNFNYTYEQYLDMMKACIEDTVLTEDSVLIVFRGKFEPFILPPPDAADIGEEGFMAVDGEEGSFSSFGGGAAMSLSSSGMAPLDTCACNLLLDIKHKYDSLSPPGLGLTFNAFYNQQVNNMGLSCEGTLDYQGLMGHCQDAYAMDDENLPFRKNRGWSTVQYFNLVFEADDYSLEFHEDCTCPTPPPIELDTSTAIPCDSLVKRMLWRRAIFNLSKVYQDANGNITDSAGYANFVKNAWDNFQEPYDYFNGTPIQGMANDTFDFHSEYWRFEQVYCHGTGFSCLVCPPGTPQVCDNCYVLNDTAVQSTLAFLNQLVTPYKTANHLVRNGWRILPTANEYDTPPLYTGSSQNSLKYRILYWDPLKSPSLDFKISDSTGHNAVWGLTFPGLGRFLQYGYIIEFSDLVPQYPLKCYNNSNFYTVKALIKKPAKYGGDTVEVKYLWGDVSNFTFYDIDTICSPVKKCNETLFTSETDTGDCRTSLTLLAKHNAQVAYYQYIDSVKKAFRAQYMRQCMEARKTEVFTMRYGTQEYHHTLYYYDQVGNLVQTVPPAGVNRITSPTTLASVQTARKNNTTPVLPSHTFLTRYTFNTLNQLAKQGTPDAGVSTFWYDAVGRLVVSRNAKQTAQSPKQYSYTIFDALGRITEVGQLQSADSMRVTKAFAADSLSTWLTAAANTRTEITRTYYDNVQYTSVQTQFSTGQLYLRKRVVSTTYSSDTGDVYDHAVHYSYDVHGYVSTLVRDNKKLETLGHRYKRIDYQYDLLSGNVHKVMYQNGKTDRFYHRYLYDADNRITHAYTSPDGVTWDNDAAYKYYRHGPLMRAEIGHQKVQGTDYAYTIHGWLKGVNSNTLRAHRDIGQDGHSTGAYPWVGGDVFGFSLSYYEGDYTEVGSISTTNHFLADISGSVLNNASPNLFNGNIRHMVTTISVLSGGTPLGSAYRYDQLNRLAQANYYSNASIDSNKWQSTGSMLTAYRNTFTYDANGNILTQNRNGHATTPAMDSLTYHYQSGTNKLEKVDDVVNSANYTDDINDQNDGNYTYDEIGNMTGDAAEQIATIQWTVYGKIKRITRTFGSTKPDLLFEYSPDGHRVMKQERVANRGPITTTWYTRDAQGNIMAIYEERNDSVWLDEQEIYGSSRLGMVKKNVLLNSLTLDTVHYQIKRGEKRYEFSNHLGNVLAVVTDKLKPICNDDTVSYFNAEVLYAYDYSPFGAILPGRMYVGDTVCSSPGHYDTLIPAQFSFVFNIGGMLTSGDEIHISSPGYDNALAVYNSSYTTLQEYIDEVIANATALGFTAEDLGGGDIRITFGLNEDYTYINCGYAIEVYSYVTNTITIYEVDCTPVPTYIPPSGCEPADYRFGFNGKEKDNEAKGIGNQQDYGMRIYDNRLGRFLSVDPITKKYPWFTPYQFASNTPVLAIDVDGLEANRNLNPSEEPILGYIGSEMLLPSGYNVVRSGQTITVTQVNSQGTIFQSSTITLASNVKSEWVTNYSAYVLHGALMEAGLNSLTISSAYRDPANQARVMYNNLVEHGEQYNRDMYAAAGEQVIDVYVASVADGCNADETKAAMEAKIKEVGPGNVSKHSSTPSVYNTLDISPKSISNKKAFQAALVKRVAPKNSATTVATPIKKFLGPKDSDPAFHIEIPQDTAGCVDTPIQSSSSPSTPIPSGP